MSWQAIGGGDFKEWAKKLREREQAGEALTLVQRKAWREALRTQDSHEIADRPS